MQNIQKLSLFLWNSEARKSSWTKRLDNCVFSFQIVSLEKDNQDQADIVLECFRCFRLWIFFSFKCIAEVWKSDSIRWDEEDVSIVDKEDSSSVEKGAEQNRLR